MAGFIVAAIVAAALSPSLNSMAAATVNDFYKRYINPGADDRTLLTLAPRAPIRVGASCRSASRSVAVDEPLRARRGPVGASHLPAGPCWARFWSVSARGALTTGPMMIGMITGIAGH
jgi:hypothetical protein